MGKPPCTILHGNHRSAEHAFGRHAGNGNVHDWGQLPATGNHSPNVPIQHVRLLRGHHPLLVPRAELPLYLVQDKLHGRKAEVQPAGPFALCPPAYREGKEVHAGHPHRHQRPVQRLRGQLLRHRLRRYHQELPPGRTPSGTQCRLLLPAL